MTFFTSMTGAYLGAVGAVILSDNKFLSHKQSHTCKTAYVFRNIKITNIIANTSWTLYNYFNIIITLCFNIYIVGGCLHNYYYLCRRKPLYLYILYFWTKYTIDFNHNITYIFILVKNESTNRVNRSAFVHNNNIVIMILFEICLLLVILFYNYDYYYYIWFKCRLPSPP